MSGNKSSLGKTPREALDAISVQLHLVKDRQISNCRIVAFRSAKVAFFRGAKGDSVFAPVLSRMWIILSPVWAISNTPTG